MPALASRALAYSEEVKLPENVAVEVMTKRKENVLSVQGLKDWEVTLASTGRLAQEREAYRVELIRLGESEADAARASSIYVPNPKMLGEAAHVAGEFLRLKKLAKRAVGGSWLVLPSGQ